LVEGQSVSGGKARERGWAHGVAGGIAVYPIQEGRHQTLDVAGVF
jgi:hypothetical protein